MEIYPEIKEEAKQKAREGFLKGVLRGMGHAMDEVGFLSMGALATHLFHQAMSPKSGNGEVLQRARKLIEEGRTEEAGELIIKAKPFGIGFGDEAGFLAGLGWAIQFFYDSDEPAKADLLVDTLAELGPDALRRLRRSLAEVESVEETGKILVKIAQVGSPQERIAKIARIVGISLDPKDHPAHVLVDSLSDAFSAATENYRAKVDKKKAAIRAKQVDKAARLAAARTR